MAHAQIERQRQESLAAQVAGPDDLAAREPMVPRQHAHRGGPAQLLGDDGRMFERHHREAEVELLVDRLLVDVGRAADVKDDVRLGVVPEKFRQHVGQDAAPQRRRRIDMKVADLPVADLARHFADPFEAVIEPRHFGGEEARLPGRGQALPDAGEQRIADLVLEARQDLAHRGLRYAQPLGRRRDSSAVDHGTEGFELARRNQHNLGELSISDNGVRPFPRQDAGCIAHD